MPIYSVKSGKDKSLTNLEVVIVQSFTAIGLNEKLYKTKLIY